MERDLGLSPGARSQALHAECVAGVRTATTTLIGRDLELARARAALDTAFQDGGHAVAVRGAAGIGKSTLCRELGAAATESGWRTFTATAMTGGDAFAPLVDAVEQLIRSDRSCLDGLPTGAHSTLAALTTLAGPAPVTASALGRHQVIGAVHRLLMACGAAAAATGVLLVVDDAHLADDATAEACGQLARTRGPFPLVVVVAFRADHPPRASSRLWPAWTGRVCSASSIWARSTTRTSRRWCGLPVGAGPHRRRSPDRRDRAGQPVLRPGASPRLDRRIAADRAAHDLGGRDQPIPRARRGDGRDAA